MSLSSVRVGEFRWANEFGFTFLSPLNCKTLLTEFQNKRVMHTYLEGKKCVDVLAKLSSSLSCNLMVFDSLLFVVDWRLLSLDAEGNACNRLIFIFENKLIFFLRSNMR